MIGMPRAPGQSVLAPLRQMGLAVRLRMRANAQPGLDLPFRLNMRRTAANLEKLGLGTSSSNSGNGPDLGLSKSPAPPTFTGAGPTALPATPGLPKPPTVGSL